MHHSQGESAFLITYWKIKYHLFKLSQMLQFYMHHGCAYTLIKVYKNHSNILVRRCHLGATQHAGREWDTMEHVYNSYLLGKVNYYQFFILVIF